MSGQNYSSKYNSVPTSLKAKLAFPAVVPHTGGAGAQQRAPAEGPSLNLQREFWITPAHLDNPKWMDHGSDQYV